MESRTKQCALAAAVAAATLALTDVVQAQQGIEEITVTAQRREENVQDVPIAISAVTGDMMETRAITNVSQVAEYTPNVYMDSTVPFSGSNSVLAAYIRGIGQGDFAFNLEPGVGVYVDGVYMARTIGANVDLLDVERLEILKGPQGTLFGRNTIGGAINVITRRPGNEFNFRGEVTGGEFDRLDIRGAVEVPLIQDQLFGMLAFSSKSRDGYQRRVPYDLGPVVVDRSDDFLAAGYQSHETAGGENSENLRGKLLWVASDAVEVTLTADWTRTDEMGTPNSQLRWYDDPENSLASLYNLCITMPPGLIPPCGHPRGVDPAFPSQGAPQITQVGLDNRVPRPAYGAHFATDDIDTSYATGNNFNKLDMFGTAAHVDWNLANGMDLSYIAAYRELDSRFGFDFDASPIPILEPSFATNQEQLSHEVQLSGMDFNDRLNWVVGLYYFQEEGDLTDYVTFGGGLLQVYGENYFDNQAWALYTHNNFALTERIGLTFGVRYTQEDKEFEGRQRDLNMIAPKDGAPPFIFPDQNDLTRYYPLGVNTRDFSDTSIRAGLEYNFTDDIMAYVSYAEGFKSGGWTTRLSQPHLTVEPDELNPSGLEFDDEQATSYELGLKSLLLDRNLQFNAAVFFTEYDDIQVTQQIGASPVFTNGGDGEITGFEAEAVWTPTANLRINASIGYLDAEYTRLAPGVNDAFGNQMSLDAMFVNVPEWDTTLAVDYDIPLGGGGTIGLHGDFTHTSEIANDFGNTPELMQGNVDLYNASIGYTPPRGNWEVLLGARNLTDERYIVTGQAQPAVGGVFGAYSRPREWFLTFRMQY